MPLRSLRRLTQLFLIGSIIALSTGAGDPNGRFDKLSHQLMCACGCSQLLGECNHVGCPDSTAMRGKLMSAVNHGDPDKTILLGFQTEYGPISLAAPRFTAFNHVAWIMPPLILVLGFGLIALTVRRWRLRPATIPAPPQQFSLTEFDSVRDRIRRETES